MYRMDKIWKHTRSKGAGEIREKRMREEEDGREHLFPLPSLPLFFLVTLLTTPVTEAKTDR